VRAFLAQDKSAKGSAIVANITVARRMAYNPLRKLAPAAP